MGEDMWNKTCENCKFVENDGIPCTTCFDFDMWKPMEDAKMTDAEFVKWVHEHCKEEIPQVKSVVEVDGSAKAQSHYQVGKVQPIEFMQMTMTPEEFQGFCRGNVIKYTSRMGHKDASIKEVDKVIQYAKWLRESLLGNVIDPRA